MNLFLIIFAAIIFVCIYLNRLSRKSGVPVLLLFILLGLFSGWVMPPLSLHAIRGVSEVCSFALVFIMFYGGFGTNWKSARTVAVESGLLSTFGVFITAGVVGAFCHYVLKWDWLEGMLMGAVISSTDAATVFSVLRAHKLGLKNNTAPMLEVESGSNDPCSYMLTAVMLSAITGDVSGGMIVWTIVSQILFGVIVGLGVAWLAVKVLKHAHFPNGFDMMFLVAVAISAYVLPQFIGGNGYLSTYIVGIIIGNTEFQGRKGLVCFFDGVTGFAQVFIFYLLGYMCIPASLVPAVIPALIIFAFLTVVARPVAITAILAPFRKYPFSQISFISFVGLRGAASIVFAIMTILDEYTLQHDIFSIVFVMVLISILFQGTLIPSAAKCCNMIDKNADVMSTFTDFQEKAEISFSYIVLDEKCEWCGKIIKELHFPKEMLVSLIIRNKQYIVPKGHTTLLAGDKIIFSAKSYQNETRENIREHSLSENSQWIGKKIKDYPYRDGSQVLMIKRGNDSIIPNGETVLHQGDVLVILHE